MTRLQRRTRQVKRTGHLVIRPVSLVDIAYPLIKAKHLSSWPRSHVTEHQRVIRSGIFGFKLAEQDFTQPADLRLINRARMMGNQTRKPTSRSVVPDPPGTIQWMKTRLCQLGSITNIVQMSCRHQKITVGQRDHMRDPARLLPNPLHVGPASAQRRQEPLRTGQRPGRQRHRDTIPTTTGSSKLMTAVRHRSWHVCGTPFLALALINPV